MILKNAKLNNVFVKPVLPKIFMLNPTIIGPKYSPISYIIIKSDVAKAISVTLILSPRYAKVTVYKLVEALDEDERYMAEKIADEMWERHTNRNYDYRY